MLHHFRDDPFFSLPDIDDPFDRFFTEFHSGPSLMNALTYDPIVERRASSRDVALRNNRNDRHQSSRDVMMFNPFDTMNAMMSDMNSMFGNIRHHMEQGIGDGHGAMFSSARVMSYNSANGGEPQYYEATSATRQGPHGLRETRRTERNSASGYDKMAVGRHIYDRGHVMTKQRNRRTGQMEEHQDFQNIDEENAAAFNNEWQEKARRYFDYGRSGRGEVGYDEYSRSGATRQHSNQDTRAIEDSWIDNRAPENEDYERSRYEKQKKNKKGNKKY